VPRAANPHYPSRLVRSSVLGRDQEHRRLARESASRLSEAVSNAVCEILGVPTNRIYVVLDDVPAQMWGCDGSTGVEVHIGPLTAGPAKRPEHPPCADTAS
jgi:phenylpyruvate tautomerase PptA (4-oxalocrotonate tautomerase family)